MPTSQQQSAKHRQFYSFREFVRIIKYRRNYIIGVTVCSIFGTLIGHAFYQFFPTYTAQATLRVLGNQDRQMMDMLQMNPMAAMVSGGTGNSEEMKMYLRHLNSNSYFLSLAETVKFDKSFATLNLTAPNSIRFTSLDFWRRIKSKVIANDAKDRPVDPITIPVDYISKALRSMIEFRPDERNFIVVAVTTLEANTSMHLANTAAELFVRTINERDGTELQETEEFLRKRLEKGVENLKDAELALVEFKKSRHFVATSSAGSLLAEQLRAVDSQLAAARLEFQQNEALLNRYKNPAVLPSGVNIPETARLAVEKRKEKRIRDLHDKNQVLQSRIDTLEASKAKFLANLANSPQDEQNLIMLERKVKQEYEEYALLQKKLSQLEIQKASNPGKLVIDQLAWLPDANQNANFFVRLLFSILAGTFFGAVVALGVESLDGTIKRRVDIEDTNINYLGEVPLFKVKENPKKNTPGLLSDRMLICIDRPESLEAMCFKFIRAKIEAITNRDGTRAKVITLTSSRSGEGKSVVSANLAISLAQLKKKVVLVDCDLRKPAVHCYFGYKNEVGLSDLLEMRLPFRQVLKKNATEYLDVVPAGIVHKNPTELVSSQQFIMLISYLRKTYDYVILDAPPVNTIVDACVTATLSDVTTLVSAYRKTHKADLLNAHRRLLQVANVKVYGILNKTEEAHELFSDYYYPYAGVTNTSALLLPHERNEQIVTEFNDLLEKDTGT